MKENRILCTFPSFIFNNSCNIMLFGQSKKSEYTGECTGKIYILPHTLRIVASTEATEAHFFAKELSLT